MYQIPSLSHLSRALTAQFANQRVPKSIYLHYELQAAPTLIKVHNDSRYLVYAGPTRELGPALFFYSLEHRCTIAKISGAEILIDCYKSYTTERFFIVTLHKDETVVLRELDLRTIKPCQHIEEILDLSTLPHVSKLPLKTEVAEDDKRWNVWINRYKSRNQSQRLIVNIHN